MSLIFLDSAYLCYVEQIAIERPVASVRPSILRSGHRKRTHQMLQTDSAPVVPAASSSTDEHLTRLNMPSLRQQPDPRGDAYVKQLVSKMSGRFESLVSTRKVSATQQSDSSVRKRLSTRKDCDLNALCCCVPLCGRSFDSLQVLAWHMSYAHQDVSISHSRNTICYLCGYQMFTAKGKNAHLTTKHRLIAERHNAECIEQRGSIIAPGQLNSLDDSS
ncbi:unnamed protein product [Anisakis simplex]|uniref:C2H2-type domain-containing protein n=1 Tax=Anisakis simplex TaxID=6269 RepID=A0A0M3J849_ANISI|nr:unnamed protein product [Anisakis simplex]